MSNAVRAQYTDDTETQHYNSKPQLINIKSTEDKVKRQLQLELEGVQAGVNAYRKTLQEKGVSELPPGIALMKQSMEPLTAAIVDFLKPCRGSQKMTLVRKFLTTLKVTPEELAYLTLKACIASLSGNKPLQNVAFTLVDMVLDQHEYAKFRQKHPGYLKRTEHDLRLATQQHKRTVVMLKKRKKGIEDDAVEQEDRFVIGCKLIDLCILSTGIVQKELVEKAIYGKPHSSYFLRGTDTVTKWVEQVNERCEMLTPQFLPMIVPPKPWQSVYGGGYYGSQINGKHKLIKTRNKKALAHLELYAMPQVYEALNAVQDTPWRVNRRVYEVMTVLWAEGSTLGGLPAQERGELPPKPWSSDEEFERMKVENPEAVTAWKRQAAPIYEEFARKKSHRTATAIKLRTAERFQEEEELYFPHCLDWRGRVYPIPNAINPQSDDMGKALIEFAKGMPLGADGLRWLKIHLANTYGNDKVSFAERVQWVEEHHREVLDSAENPLDGLRWWSDADSPFCFLAACFEYAEAVKEGPAYVSHLPIAQDGTCSGLQHYSAMLRDSGGGREVNLMPADTPQDIYRRVAEKVSEMVNKDAAEGIEEAKLWQGKIDRGIAKRAVMTTPYGAKRFGFKEQLLSEITSRGADFLGTRETHKPALYLAGLLQEAIGQVVFAAKAGMEWFQLVARVCCDAKVPMTWTTPVGFKAYQEYLETETKEVYTFWGGVRVHTNLKRDTGKLDKRSQANGIAPNVVHSLDASHLMLTVLECKRQGITDFAMIHDSFGTHAGNSGKLAGILRETFMEQYSGNVLESFREEILRQLPENLHHKIPAVPPMGDLRLEDVRESLYFFA